MKKHFKIKYEFDKAAVHKAIEERLAQPGSDYICVADGVVANTAYRHQNYRKVVNGGMFCICDSSYIPMYLHYIYGSHLKQYSGSMIFMDIVKERRYRMIFLGASQEILDSLKTELTKVNPDVKDMQFVELPFLRVEEFDYPAIARMIEADGADIIWVALGAPKQEQFMYRLKEHLGHGVMLGVGAVFKFYSGKGVNRAPQWMVKNHLEFVHRLMKEPKKQVMRCAKIMYTLPSMLLHEWRHEQSSKRKRGR